MTVDPDGNAAFDADGAGEAGDVDALTTLRRVPTSFEAHTIVAVLAEAGIEATVFDTAEAGLGIPLGPGGGSVPVMVRARDLQAARAAVAANVADSVDLDWDEIDVGVREDQLPLHRVGRIPPPAAVGLIVAILLVILVFVAWVWLLVGALAIAHPYHES